MLPDVSTMNKILAGMSALPVPGGGDLAKTGDDRSNSNPIKNKSGNFFII
jgi:hypothetical protein